MISVLSSLRKSEQVGLLLLSSWWHVNVNVLCLILTEEPWAGLHCVIVQFPGHAHLLFV